MCAERDTPIGELEAMSDRAHLLVSCDPRYGVHRLVTQTKGRSSRLPRREFPHLRSQPPTLWTNSSFVATVGGATKRYVENQHNVQSTPLPPQG